MKKIIPLVLFLALVNTTLWWLVSPLFFDDKVNEALPKTVKSLNKMSVLGTFEDADESHKASGNVYIIKNGSTSIIRFDNFNVSNGTDLYVVLSSNKNPNRDEPGELIILEKLKGNIGNQNYTISNSDLERSNSIMIYSKAFSEVFGFANLR